MGVKGSIVASDEYAAPSQENRRPKKIKAARVGVFVYERSL